MLTAWLFCPCLQHFVAEHRVDHLLLGAERPAALARVTFDGAQLQAELLRHRLEFGQGRERLVRQQLRALVEERLRLLAPVVRLQLGAHVVEAALRAGLDALELDDVVTELGLDRALDFARLHGEQCVGERTDEAVARRPAKVAALPLRTRVVGILARRGGEVGTGLRASAASFSALAFAAASSLPASTRMWRARRRSVVV